MKNLASTHNIITFRSLSDTCILNIGTMSWGIEKDLRERVKNKNWIKKT